MTSEAGGVAEGVCRVCSGALASFLVARDENRRTDHRRFPYLRCERCGTIVLASVPRDLSRYYASDYYAIPTAGALERSVSHEQHRVDTLRGLVERGRVVEIGSAWGVFAQGARDAGYEVTAVEMDEACCAHLSEVVGVEVVRSDQPQEVLPTLAPADAVVLWQTVEHLPDPLATLEAAVDALSPGGVILMATPNPESYGFRLMGEAWPHLDAPRHLWLFPPGTLVAFLSQRGCRLDLLEFDDAESRSWNRFAWQRFLMNRTDSAWAGRLGWMAGLVLAALAAPLERRRGRSSSYTIAFRKEIS